MTQNLSSPIAFFSYNRPDHTRRSLEALRANYLASQSRLFIFSDGAKNDSAREGVEQVREYISTVDGFASVDVVERPHNYGCAKNIIDGITQVVNEFGRVIVVEDDILTSPYFLSYMNDALELYKDDDNVAVISGYLHPMYYGHTKPDGFFSYDLGTWGWGTWQRSWKDYEYDAAKILKQIQDAGLEDKYNYGLKSKPCSGWLILAAGKSSIWDYQLQAVMFLLGRMTLRPGRTFTNNIGLDGTGLHCGTCDYNAFNLHLAEEYHPLKKIPVELDMRMYEIFRKSLMPRSLPYRAVRKIWRIFKRVFLKH